MTEQHRGYEFEREVAAIYRTLGANVQLEVALAGTRIDILVEETTPSGSTIRSAVECKAFSRPVGVDVVRQVASITMLLGQRSQIDRGVIVALSGFTASARAMANEIGIELLELADLQQRVAGKATAVQAAENKIDQEAAEARDSTSQPKRVFVVMPFAAEFDDVYILGIREVAERLEFTVDRADDIEHNENILDVVQQQIRDCDAIIADITGKNANVFYEVGYAHSAGTPTVLACRQGEDVPFDLRAINYISYSSIVDLREKLETRLKSMFAE